MAMTQIPHIVIDDFLPSAMHRGLLAHVLTVDDFAIGKLLIGNNHEYMPKLRQGLDSQKGLGPFRKQFRTAVRARFDDLCAGLNIPPFELARLETDLKAYGDGGFFKRHSDVFTGTARLNTTSVRVITLVYYFHRQPRGFFGGELQLFPFGNQPPVLIEPRDNRLIAFPSHLVHEIRPVAVPDRDFANSRFSISAWFNRSLHDSTRLS